MHSRKNNLGVKDTANPLSHHVMASPKRFSFIQALAPMIINNCFYTLVSDLSMFIS